MSHIFISYRSTEQIIARELQTSLHSRGHKTWLDIDKLNDVKDNNWESEIEIAIQSAATVVVVLTKASNASRFVTGEWDIAIIESVPLIFCQFEYMSVSKKYTNIPIIDFISQNHVDAIGQLTDFLLSENKDYVQIDTIVTEYLKKSHKLYGLKIAQKTINPLKLYGQGDQRTADTIPLKAVSAPSELSDGFANVENSQNIFELIDTQQAHNMIIMGESGAGKTVTLYHLFRDQVICHLQKVTEQVPIFASLSRYDTAERLPISQWLQQVSEPKVSLDISELLEAGQAILILDGLDELHITSKEDELDAYNVLLAELLNVSKGNQIIVSCRQNRLPKVQWDRLFRHTIKLLPFDLEQIETYLRNNELEKLRLLIDKVPNLKTLITTPLLLSLLAFTFEENMTSEQRDRLEQFQTEGDLRDILGKGYVERRFNHEIEKESKKPEEMDFSLEMIYEILGHAGIVSLGDDRTFQIHNLVQNQDFALDPNTAIQFTKFASSLHLVTTNENAMQDFVHAFIRDYFTFSFAKTNIRNDALYHELSDEDASNPARALARIGDERGIDELLDYLEELLQLSDTDRNIALRKNIVSALRIWGHNKSFQLLSKIIETTKDFNLHVLALYAMAELKHPQALDVLIDSMGQRFELKSPYTGKLLVQPSNASITIKTILEKNLILSTIMVHHQAALNQRNAPLYDGISFLLAIWGEFDYLYSCLRELISHRDTLTETVQDFGIPLARCLGIAFEENEGDVSRVLAELKFIHRAAIRRKDIVVNRLLCNTFSVTKHIDHLINCLEILDWNDIAKADLTAEMAQEVDKSIAFSINNHKDLLENIETVLQNAEYPVFVNIIAALSEYPNDKTITFLIHTLTAFTDQDVNRSNVILSWLFRIEIQPLLSAILHLLDDSNASTAVKTTAKRAAATYIHHTDPLENALSFPKLLKVASFKSQDAISFANALSQQVSSNLFLELETSDPQRQAFIINTLKQLFD